MFTTLENLACSWRLLDVLLRHTEVQITQNTSACRTRFRPVNIGDKKACSCNTFSFLVKCELRLMKNNQLNAFFMWYTIM